MSAHDEYPIPQFHPVSTPSSTPPSSCSSRPRSSLGWQFSLRPNNTLAPIATVETRRVDQVTCSESAAALDWTGPRDLDLSLELDLDLGWRARGTGREIGRERERLLLHLSISLQRERVGRVPGALLSSSPHAVRPFCVYHAIRSISVVLYSVMRLHHPLPFPIPFSSFPPFPIPLLLACAHQRPTHADAEGKSNNTRRPPG